MNAIKIRSVEEQEIDHLARLWYVGWQDAHAQIVPAELRRLRSLDSFKHRLQSALRDTRVVGPLGRPLGFCTTKGNELYQIYVSAEARGTGVAAALMTDAETRLEKGGFDVAWLACAIGNDRAARFYEKSGWRRVGVVAYQAETAAGTFPLEVWRYEKNLRQISRSARIDSKTERFVTIRSERKNLSRAFWLVRCRDEAKERKYAKNYSLLVV